VAKKTRPWEATAFDDPAMLRVIRDKDDHIVAFGRTRLGQAAYDVMLSSMSAAEAARRHKLDRAFVLEMRHKPHIQKMRLKRRRSGRELGR
jgi:hypothetical protein